ncbi:MAG: hypothetical protein HQL82_15665 [Magnetococcales bacterium]|nr:hypothetical protein [Magnetococcales bacterium]
MANLTREFQGRTILMIAHRLATVRNCDQIVCLNKGLIVEKGTYDSLMDTKGFFCHLNSQALE